MSTEARGWCLKTPSGELMVITVSENRVHIAVNGYTPVPVLITEVTPEYRERDGCWSCRWRCGHPEDLHCAEREKQVQLWGTCGHHEPEEGSE